MSEEKKTKTERVVFPKDATAENMFDAIRAKQDEWAKSDPAEAHKRYPRVYDEKGNRIKK